MKSTIHGHGGAGVSVPAFATSTAPFAAGSVRAAGVAASRPAVAVRLNSVGLSGVGRGMWRGQPSFVSAPAAVLAATAPAAPATNARISTLDRVNKFDRNATKQFRTTVYEGPRPWKVPV